MIRTPSLQLSGFSGRPDPCIGRIVGQPGLCAEGCPAIRKKKKKGGDATGYCGDIILVCEYCPPPAMSALTSTKYFWPMVSRW